MDAPERWEAQDAILREARFAAGRLLYVKALRLVGIARELGTLSQSHEAEAQQIQTDHDRHHFKKAAA